MFSRLTARNPRLSQKCKRELAHILPWRSGLSMKILQIHPNLTNYKLLIYKSKDFERSEKDLIDFCAKCTPNYLMAGNPTSWRHWFTRAASNSGAIFPFPSIWVPYRWGLPSRTSIRSRSNARNTGSRLAHNFRFTRLMAASWQWLSKLIIAHLTCT